MNSISTKGQKHKHVWQQTTKRVTRDSFWGWLFKSYYKANINQCKKCPDWYYITI